mmetsp:Transcript_25163/g.100155  ORF Transcript_25163/g.100155 Transcript_25163/m.100155 type:complete len:379 (-) Transcript_25163:1063-2199(-)
MPPRRPRPGSDAETGPQVRRPARPGAAGLQAGAAPAQGRGRLVRGARVGSSVGVQPSLHARAHQDLESRGPHRGRRREVAPPPRRGDHRPHRPRQPAAPQSDAVDRQGAAPRRRRGNAGRRFVCQGPVPVLEDHPDQAPHLRHHRRTAQARARHPEHPAREPRRARVGLPRLRRRGRRRAHQSCSSGDAGGVAVRGGWRVGDCVRLMIHTVRRRRAPWPPTVGGVTPTGSASVSQPSFEKDGPSRVVVVRRRIKEKESPKKAHAGKNTKTEEEEESRVRRRRRRCFRSITSRGRRASWRGRTCPWRSRRRPSTASTGSRRCRRPRRRRRALLSRRGRRGRLAARCRSTTSRPPTWCRRRRRRPGRAGGPTRPPRRSRP